MSSAPPLHWREHWAILKNRFHLLIRKIGSVHTQPPLLTAQNLPSNEEHLLTNGWEKHILNGSVELGFKREIATCATRLRICGNIKDLFQGESVHTSIIEAGYEKSSFLGSLLVQMYVKCAAHENALACFDKIRERNVYPWNFMLGAYAWCASGNEAFRLFEQMLQEGVIPDVVTYVFLISACTNQSTLVKGRWTHARAMLGGLAADVVVGSALVSMYAKLGSLVDAQKMFDKMPERNVVSWNAIIDAYSQKGRVKDSIQLVARMQMEGVIPGKVTFVSLLSGCASQENLGEGLQIHNCIRLSELESDVVLGTALISMYGRCGNLRYAQRVFNAIPVRDVVAWNAILAMYSQNAHSQEALQLFEQMQREGIAPDRFTMVSVLDAYTSQTYLTKGKQLHDQIVLNGFESDGVIATALINMYGKCGSLEDARSMFDKSPRRDGVSWTAMIATYAQHNCGPEALQLFDDMQGGGVSPDKVTYVSMLDACASQAALAQGTRIHAYIVHHGFDSDNIIATALVNMYGKCGKLEDAQKMFDRGPAQSVISWNTLIATYAQSGCCNELLKLLDQMKLEGVIPNNVTILSVLFACSHAGLIDEGWYCLNTINQDHGIALTIEHYDCMTDLLGRAGLLDEAEDLISRMPFQPSFVSWTALLGACRNHVDVGLGEFAAKYMFELDPEDDTPYVILSSIYAVVA